MDSLEVDIHAARISDKLRDEIQDLETENECFKEEIKQLKSDLANLAAMSGREAKLSAELKAKMANITNLRESLTDAEARLAESNVLVANLNARLKHLSEALAAARSDRYILQQRDETRRGTSTTVSPREMPKELPEEIYAEPLLAELTEKPLLDEIEAMKRRHVRELQKLQQEHARAERQLQRLAREELDEKEKNTSNRIFQYQALIATLEDRIAELEGKPKELRIVEPQVKPPIDQYSITLPGVATSVCVPVSGFVQHDNVLIHIVLPPQRLNVVRNGGVLTLEKAEVQKYHERFIDMTKYWT